MNMFAYHSLVVGRLLVVWVALLLALPAARAQAPAWQSVITSSPNGPNDSKPYVTNSSQVQATATDAAGNVYLAGQFDGTVKFGSISLTSRDDSGDVFVAKWDPVTRSFVWAQRAGGTGADYVQALAVSGTGVYVTGGFLSATADFGGTVLANATNSATATGSDVFVAKLTEAGRFVWAQQAGGPGADYAVAVAVSGANVYVTGAYESPGAVFGEDTLAVTGLFGNKFLAKLTDAGPTGSFGWAQQISISYLDFPSSLAASGANVYVAGAFSGVPTDAGGPLRSAAGNDGRPVLFKYRDEGDRASFVWAQRTSAATVATGSAVAVSGNNVFLAGNFTSPTFSLGLGATALANAAADESSDLFVAKLVDAGPQALPIWAQGAGGTGYDRANAIALNGASVYVAGNFVSATAYFGSTALANAGYDDVYVAKLTDAGPSGRFVWAQQAGGADSDGATAVAVGGASVYAGGNVRPPASFGQLTVASVIKNYDVGFLALLTDSTPLATAAPALPGAGMALYPNPARAVATVLVPPVPGAARATFALLDALGRTVRTQSAALPAAGLRTELNLAGLAPGVYALRLAAGAYATTTRLVIE